jgi:hypothetical protein
VERGCGEGEEIVGFGLVEYFQLSSIPERF